MKAGGLALWHEGVGAVGYCDLNWTGWTGFWRINRIGRGDVPAHIGDRILANAPTAGWLGFEFRLLLSAKRRWREWDCRWLSESGSALLDALSLRDALAERVGLTVSFQYRLRFEWCLSWRDALAERVGLTSLCSVLPLSLRSFGSNHLEGRGFKSHLLLAAKRPRRGWDSNPRMVSHLRFSRPTRSTTLPPLLVAADAGLFTVEMWGCQVEV